MIRKVAGAVVTLIIAVTVAFVLARISGDPILGLLGETASAQDVSAMKQALGLDAPLVNQYFNFLASLAEGNLGESIRYQRSNWEVISTRLPASLWLAGAAMLIGVVLGIPAGVFAAVKENTVWDRVSMALTLVGQSLPLFWVGMLLIVVFSLNLGWFPAGQSGTIAHLVLPSLALSLFPLARIARITRSSMTEVLEEDFITAARARGLSRRRVIVNHALRNAFLTVLTVIGLQAAGLISTAVTIEHVFSWPGIGQLAMNAVLSRDFTLVQAIVVVCAFIFIIVNLIVDFLYTLLDPRIR